MIQILADYFMTDPSTSSVVGPIFPLIVVSQVLTLLAIDFIHYCLVRVLASAVSNLFLNRSCSSGSPGLSPNYSSKKLDTVPIMLDLLRFEPSPSVSLSMIKKMREKSLRWLTTLLEWNSGSLNTSIPTSAIYSTYCDIFGDVGMLV